MSSAFPKSPILVKGAFIQLTEGVAGPVPAFVPFQYNPDTLTRKIEPWQPPAPPATPEGGGSTDAQAQPYDPNETIDLALLFDATDLLEEPDSHPIAVATGIADRLCALERMLYPVEDGGGLLADAAALLGGEASGAVPRSVVPVVLFSFGPGLIVPIRITAYSVEEQAWSTTLYPLRAKVTVSLKVLTDREFPEEGANAQTGIAAEIARSAYRFTRTQRDLLAVANLGDGAATLLNSLV